jgi:hypothetical protein
MKGVLRTVIEKARWTDVSTIVQFRDKDHLVEVPFAVYWAVANQIPENRIARVIQNGIPVFITSRTWLLSLPIVKQTSYVIKNVRLKRQ